MCLFVCFLILFLNKRTCWAVGDIQGLYWSWKTWKCWNFILKKTTGPGKMWKSAQLKQLSSQNLRYNKCMWTVRRIDFEYWEWKGLLWNLESWENQSEWWKSLWNLFSWKRVQTLDIHMYDNLSKAPFDQLFYSVIFKHRYILLNIEHCENIARYLPLCLTLAKLFILIQVSQPCVIHWHRHPPWWWSAGITFKSLICIY